MYFARRRCAIGPRRTAVFIGHAYCFYPNFAFSTSFSFLYQQFNDGDLLYCVLQILIIVIFLYNIFLYISYS